MCCRPDYAFLFVKNVQLSVSWIISVVVFFTTMCCIVRFAFRPAATTALVIGLYCLLFESYLSKYVRVFISGNWNLWSSPALSALILYNYSFPSPYL